MCPPRISKARSPFVCRCDFASKLKAAAIYPCINCANDPSNCKVGPESEQCACCVYNSWKCDLVISLAEIDKIKKTQKEVWAEIKSTQARLIRL